MIVQFSAQIESAKANNDRTLSLKVDTQELSAEDTAKIFSFFQKQIWIAFAETAISKEQLNIPEVVTEMDRKTPAQRLRDRMFIYFEKKNGKKDGFEEWYVTAMDKLGSNYLEKIQ